MAKSVIYEMVKKKFNLDGSDDLHYYHRDLRKEQLPSRSIGGGGVMIGGNIGKLEIKFVTGKLYSKKLIVIEL